LNGEYLELTGNTESCKSKQGQASCFALFIIFYLGVEIKYNRIGWTCSVYGDVKKWREKFV